MEARAAPGRKVEPRWVLTGKPDSGVLERVKRELSVPTVVARILVNRGISDGASARRFLRPALDQLFDPFLLTDMQLAVDRIRRAIQAGERVMVYGDYDVDGVTGTSVALRALRRLGADVSFYIPHRIEEGYGISRAGVDEAFRRQVGLLISVDCGITANREVEYARELGIDVIVTDHHQPGILPRAVAVVNPKREDCPYPFKELPGVALAFKLADALFRSEGRDAGLLHEDLDLVALGCAADIVPLVDENRVLVKHGLGRMLDTQNVGLRALIESVGLGGKPIGTGQVVFMLAPRINAVGRMGSATEAVEMLTTGDLGAARQIAERLEVQNRLRREADDRTLSEALDMVEKEVDFDRDRAVVLASERWHPGVIGIVASRIVEKVYLPTVLIALDGPRGKGSARSIPGFDLYRALSACQGHLAAFGGHKYAAGLTIERDRVEGFRSAFQQAVKATISPEDLTPQIVVDEEVSLGQIDDRLVNILRDFAPFGPQNMRPTLASRGVEVVGSPSTVGRNHIRFKARQDGRILDCIGFDMGHLLYRLTPGEPNLDMAYVIEENEWRGKKTVQLRVKDLR